MASGLRVPAGGIAGLLTLIREHKEAVEFDLIELGLRLDWLGSETLTWHDLAVIVRQSPPGSAVRRSAMGADAPWSLTDLLLAQMIDNTNLLIWLQSADGQKNQNRPKPLPRPGVKDDSKRHGSEPLPLDEMTAWLGWDKEAPRG